MHTIRTTQLLRNTTTIAAALAATTLISWTAASASYADRPAPDSSSHTASPSSAATPTVEQAMTQLTLRMAAYRIEHGLRIYA